jgi:surface-anchored protein
MTLSFRHFPGLFAAAFSLTALTALPAAAQIGPGTPRLTTEHVDIAIGFSGGTWDLHLHDEDNNLEIEPDEAVLFAGPAALRSRPAGSQFDFLGVPAGSNIWVLPQGQNPLLLFLGIAGEEIAPGIFQNNQVTLSLVAVNGPGQFSVWQTDAFGDPVVRMATANGITAGDSLPVAVGGHDHYNFGFTARGLYEVQFEAFGTLAATGARSASGPVTYYFEVDPLPASSAAPEPASLLLLTAGIGAAGLARRRRTA